MQRVYDLYAVYTDTLNAARLVVERALAVTLQAHESDYGGGDYFLLRMPDGEFTLQRNFIAYDEAYMEAAFSDVPFVLYVSRPILSERIREALEAEEGIRLLRHQVI